MDAARSMQLPQAVTWDATQIKEEDDHEGGRYETDKPGASQSSSATAADRHTALLRTASMNSNSNDNNRRRKIKRLAASCEPCQRKKTKCNRVSPCEACTNRGETCVWQSAKPLQTLANREANVSNDLKSAVTALSFLVSQIQSMVHESSSGVLQPPARDALKPVYGLGVPSPDPARRSLSSLSSLSSLTSTSVTPEPSASKVAVYLQNHDICEALAHLAVGHLQIQKPRQSGLKSCTVLQEALVLVNSLPQTFGLDYTMPTFNPLNSSSTNGISKLLSRLPGTHLANASSDYYHRYMDSLFHPLHVPIFKARAQLLQSQVYSQEYNKIDISFVATYLAVCAIGTQTMGEEYAVSKGFAPGSSRTLSKEWLCLSLEALNLGHFFDEPAFEALRALFLISAFFICQSDGNSAAPALKTLALTVQLAYDIGLDQDPEEFEQPFTLIEAEERRRFIHTLLSFQITFTGSLGRTSGHAISRHVLTCRLPLDCNDEDLIQGSPILNVQAPQHARETAMSPVLARIRLADLSKDLNDLLLAPGPVSTTAIEAMDKRFRHFNDSLPSWYELRFENGEVQLPGSLKGSTRMRALILHMCLWTEFLRLHRPFLSLGATEPRSDQSQTGCIEAARILLGIHRLPVMRQMWAGLQYKAYNAAIALGIYTLGNADDPQVEVYLNEIRQARNIMSAFCDRSVTVHKAVHVLDLLISKVRQLFESKARVSNKRGRILISNDPVDVSPAEYRWNTNATTSQQIGTGGTYHKPRYTGYDPMPTIDPQSSMPVSTSAAPPNEHEQSGIAVPRQILPASNRLKTAEGSPSRTAQRNVTLESPPPATHSSAFNFVPPGTAPGFPYSASTISQFHHQPAASLYTSSAQSRSLLQSSQLGNAPVHNDIQNTIGQRLRYEPLNQPQETNQTPASSLSFLGLHQDTIAMLGVLDPWDSEFPSASNNAWNDPADWTLAFTTESDSTSHAHRP